MQSFIHQHRFTVRGFECGPEGRMHMLHFCNYLQDIADRHASELGVGIQHLWEQRLAWVLTRLRLVIRDLPSNNQTFTLQTWPVMANKLYTWRQFRLLDNDGRPIVRGASAWVVINVDERAVVRMPQAVRDIIPPENAPEELPLGEDPSKTPPVTHELSDAIVPFRARLSDLDLLGHVNNATLCQWLMEANIPFMRERGLSPVEFSVRFRKELRSAGQALSRVHRIRDDDVVTCRHTLCSAEDGAPLVMGLSRWHKG